MQFLPYNYVILLLVLFFTMAECDTLPVRLLTHNIRFATKTPGTGEKPWAERKPLIVSELRYHTIHNQESFICLQEVLNEQLVDVLAGLNQGDVYPDEWAYIGVGRNDGKTKGEYSPIIFRPKIWEVKSWKTVWLSETPDEPSKGWDAASIRIVTIGIFKHRKTSKTIVGMNTHLDDQGAVSRAESAKLLLKTINETKSNQTGQNDSLPVFLAGDFNSEPSGEAYKIISGSAGLHDMRDLALPSRRYGENYTSTGFKETSKKSLIDFIFIGEVLGYHWAAPVRGYSVLPNKFEDGVYNSDHRAVVGDVDLLV